MPNKRKRRSMRYLRVTLPCCMSWLVVRSSRHSQPGVVGVCVHSLVLHRRHIDDNDSFCVPQASAVRRLSPTSAASPPLLGSQTSFFNVLLRNAFTCAASLHPVVLCCCASSIRSTVHSRRPMATASPNRTMRQLKSSTNGKLDASPNKAVTFVNQLDEGDAAAEAVFQEFSMMRSGRSSSPLANSGSNQLHFSKNGSPMRSAPSPSSLAVKQVAPIDDEFLEPVIPRSLLPQAAAKLRLHFSERELSTEVMLSRSKSGLNHDEFMFLVTSNISRRMSVEKVIKAFLELQPSGRMSIDELRILVSAAIRLESSIYDGANFEPLAQDEFDTFCGKVDPRGVGHVHILTLLRALFPNISAEVLEEVLAHYGIGIAAERLIIINAEEAGRASLVEDEDDAFEAVWTLSDESKADALQRERAAALARAASLSQLRQQAEAERERRNKEQRALAEQQEVASRTAVIDAERSERTAIAQADAKSKRDIARALAPPPPKPKSEAGCCRIVKE